MKTAILTDSGSAMTIQQAQEHGIFLLPLQVIDEEHSYQDGVDISTEELYEALRKQHTPKTSMPVGSVIEATLRTIKEQGYEEIVSVPLSSGLSSTFNTIQVMAREIGIPVIHIEDFTTCDLKRGGRLTPLAAAAASLLKIKPVLIIDPSTQGKIDVLEKVRTEKKAAAHAVDTISEKLAGREGYVYVIHSDCLEKAEDIRRQLLERNSRLEIRINTISAVIAAHTGLDCIAIQYIEK